MHRSLAAALAALLPAALAITAQAATLITIDSEPSAGHPALAIGHDGLPVIAYQSLANRLIVARCLDWACSEVQRTEVAGSYNTSRYLSLAIALNGNPAIAFREQSPQRLSLVRCVTPDCSGSGHVFRIIDDSSPSIGGYVSMAIDPDGRAAFAYQDFSAGDLVLARCTAPGCANVTTEVLEESIGGAVHGMDAGIAFGNRSDPVVAARWTNGAGDGAMRHYDCATSPCRLSGQMMGYTLGHRRGIGLSMAIAPDDRSVMAYQDETDNALHFSKCSLPDCSTGGFWVALDEGSLGIGPYAAIATFPDGRPVIAYQKHLTVAGGASALYVAECDDGSCASFDLLQIDAAPPGLSRGEDPSIAIDHDGAPVIAYFDQSNLDIKLARCSPSTCAGPGDQLFFHGFQ